MWTSTLQCGGALFCGEMEVPRNSVIFYIAIIAMYCIIVCSDQVWLLERAKTILRLDIPHFTTTTVVFILLWLCERIVSPFIFNLLS